MFSGCQSLTSLDLSNFNTSKATDMFHIFYRVGKDQNEGTKLKLNKTFNKKYSTYDNYYFPYSYYTKEVNGKFDNRLYTLSEMETETTGSNTPTTWVPAYQVNYDKGSGDSVSGTTPKTYRIGTKINTNGLLGIKSGYNFTNWANNTEGTGDIIIKKDGLSEKSYGDKYASVGTNNVMMLYAQYEQQENVPYIDKQDKIESKPKEKQQVKKVSKNPYTGDMIKKHIYSAIAALVSIICLVLFAYGRYQKNKE